MGGFPQGVEDVVRHFVVLEPNRVGYLVLEEPGEAFDAEAVWSSDGNRDVGAIDLCTPS